jgi:hypothetical protein
VGFSMYGLSSRSFSIRAPSVSIAPVFSCICTFVLISICTFVLVKQVFEAVFHACSECHYCGPFPSASPAPSRLGKLYNMYAYLPTYLHKYIRMRIHPFTRARTHTHTNTHTHTHLPLPARTRDTSTMNYWTRLQA